MLNWPMSSPQMTRMFGFVGAALLRQRRRGKRKAQRREGGEQRRAFVHDVPREAFWPSQLQGG